MISLVFKVVVFNRKVASPSTELRLTARGSQRFLMVKDNYFFGNLTGFGNLLGLLYYNNSIKVTDNLCVKFLRILNTY